MPSHSTCGTGGLAMIVTVEYDAEARASYQRMSDKPITRTVEREDGAIVDLAADGTTVGIERLYA